MYKFLLLFLLIGCGSRSEVADVPRYNDEKLAAKELLYKELLAPYQDNHGFIGTESCDATLFSGLLGAAYPGQVDIMSAFDGDVWHRRPEHDCGPSFGNSRSTISRDMMLGVMWHMWRNRQVEDAEDLMEMLKGNNYVMPGDGSLGELLINPSMLSTLAEMINALGGKRYPLELAYPAVFSEGDGFVSHLTVWHILLRGEITGKVPNRDFSILRSLSEREPQNPLYQAAYHRYYDGNQSSAIELLLNEYQWPDDRLPTTEEHCSEWPIQRDKGDDWEPCPGRKPNHQHNGAEWLVVYKLLIEG